LVGFTSEGERKSWFKPGRPKAIFEMLPTEFDPRFCFTVFGSILVPVT
jgi:hypothetical protein